MPFCYRCGENESAAHWDSDHNCCKDCAAVYDLDRFREKGFWCDFCGDFVSTVMFNSKLQCKECGGMVEVRFK